MTDAALPRIAVIGAGISGLAAALRLQDSGVASTVYEADSRVGGRMHSHTWPNGQVSEWGGELIDTRHQTLFALARRFGLELDDLVAAAPDGSEPTYSFDGRYYPYTSASSDFGPVYEALQKDLASFTWPVTYDSTDGAGHGLVGIRERVGLFGGTLTAGTRPDGGFMVRATLVTSH